MAKKVYMMARIPEYATRQFPSQWVEVEVLARTKIYAMCRRRDTPGAMPFVRAVKDLKPCNEVGQ